jgi:hypothetical protein
MTRSDYLRHPRFTDDRPFSIGIGNLSSFDEVLADALRIARPCAERLGRSRR